MKDDPLEVLVDLFENPDSLNVMMDDLDPFYNPQQIEMYPTETEEEILIKEKKRFVIGEFRRCRKETREYRGSNHQGEFYCSLDSSFNRCKHIRDDLINNEGGAYKRCTNYQGKRSK